MLIGYRNIAGAAAREAVEAYYQGNITLELHAKQMNYGCNMATVRPCRSVADTCFALLGKALNPLGTIEMPAADTWETTSNDRRPCHQETG